jgi:hypothetical protein
MNQHIITRAIAHAFATAAYIALVASGMFYMPKVLHLENTPDTVLAPIAALSLFVLSAAITSFLVFGFPLLWYIDGKRKEAVWLFGATIVALSMVTLSIFIAIALIR